jgi:hypothetical protein
MKNLDNQPYHQAMARQHYTAHVNMALPAVSEITEKEEGSRHCNMVRTNVRHMKEAENTNKKGGKGIFSPSFIAQFYHILRVAELRFNHPIMTDKGFVKVYDIVRALETKSGWETASAWKNLIVTEHKTHLSALLTTLPNAPLPVPDMKPYYTTKGDV